MRVAGAIVVAPRCRCPCAGYKRTRPKGTGTPAVPPFFPDPLLPASMGQLTESGRSERYNGRTRLGVLAGRAGFLPAAQERVLARIPPGFHHPRLARAAPPPYCSPSSPVQVQIGEIVTFLECSCQVRPQTAGRVFRLSARRVCPLSLRAERGISLRVIASQRDSSLRSEGQPAGQTTSTRRKSKDRDPFAGLLCGT